MAMKMRSKFKRGGNPKLPPALKNRSVKVGLPRTQLAQYPSDTDDAGPTVIQVGIWNEFGAPKAGIPERSFLRASVTENKDKYRKLKKKLIKRVLKREITLDQALNSLGLVAAGDVKKFIVDLKDPPNSSRTVREKKSENPLVDTGLLRNSIQHVVGD